MNKLLSTKELAEYLGIPVNTLYQWRVKGYGPPGRRVGKYIRYAPEEVQKWLQNQPEGIR